MLVGTGASLGITGTGTIAASTTNIIIANEGVTGTTANYLAKLTGAPSTAVVAGTSDTSGVVGIVVSGAGTTGSALIARSGSASCAFDGATTAGDYVIVSTTAAGKCHDTGAATYPSGNIQVLGRVLSTNVGAGTYAMTLHMGTQGGMAPLSSDGTNITLASGQLLLPAGTAANPSWAVGGEQTGFYLSSASTLGLATGGGARYTFTSAAISPISTGARTIGTSGARFSAGYFGGQTLTTTVTPQVNIDGVTWNDSGTTHQLIYGNVTDTASAAASTLIDLRVGSVSKFSVDKTGAVSAASVSAGSVIVTSNVLYNAGILTAATMSEENTRQLRTVTHSYSWSNAQVAALGAALEGDITVATLPAKTQVLDAAVVITGTAAGTTTLTVSCGDAIAGTPFTNYILPSNAQAASNTFYGDANAERGASLDGDPLVYLPSYTATTLVTCHFISTGANLSAVTGSTGRVILTTRLLP